MVRTIKFRAWDKLLKKMFYDVIHHDGTAFAVNQRGDAVWIPLQFTGLLDKAGKEIYEGDIVKVEHPLDKTGDFAGTLGEVIFYDGAFCHVGHRGRPPKTMWKYCEVVGNIHENPELLERDEDDS